MYSCGSVPEFFDKVRCLCPENLNIVGYYYDKPISTETVFEVSGISLYGKIYIREIGRFFDPKNFVLYSRYVRPSHNGRPSVYGYSRFKW